MDIRTALDVITGFIDGFVDELEEDSRQELEKAENTLYTYVEEKETSCKIKHSVDQVVNLFPMRYYPCPHCGKTLENRNAYAQCENEREFYCDDCDTTYVIEDDAVYEEPND